MTRVLAALLAVLALYAPAAGIAGEMIPVSGTMDNKRIVPTVTYLGRGPNSFAPLQGDAGIFVGSTPPIFTSAADLWFFLADGGGSGVAGCVFRGWPRVSLRLAHSSTTE